MIRVKYSRLNTQNITKDIRKKMSHRPTFIMDTCLRICVCWYVKVYLDYSWGKDIDCVFKCVCVVIDWFGRLLHLTQHDQGHFMAPMSLGEGQWWPLAWIWKWALTVRITNKELYRLTMEERWNKCAENMVNKEEPVVRDDRLQGHLSKEESIDFSNLCIGLSYSLLVNKWWRCTQMCGLWL